MLQCLVTSRFPPSPGFLLKVVTSTFHLVGHTDHHPASWVVAATSRHFLYLCTAPRFIKLLQTPEKVCEACSACMEKWHCLKAGKGHRNHQVILPAMGRVTERKKWAGFTLVFGHLQLLWGCKPLVAGLSSPAGQSGWCRPHEVHMSPSPDSKTGLNENRFGQFLDCGQTSSLGCHSSFWASVSGLSFCCLDGALAFFPSYDTTPWLCYFGGQPEKWVAAAWWPQAGPWQLVWEWQPPAGTAAHRVPSCLTRFWWVPDEDVSPSQLFAAAVMPGMPSDLHSGQDRHCRHLLIPSRKVPAVYYSKQAVWTG